MAQNPRKRQKKLEQKSAKRKAHKQELSLRHPTDLRARLLRAASGAVVHAFATDAIWSQGIGHVLISREYQQSQLAYAVFLVDAYCLGVKDAFSGIKPRSEVNSLAENLAGEFTIIKLKPACARNLVEGAVDFARNLGIAPHPDYQSAKLLFGDIDASACTETYTYGQDGKPFFIAGPHDSPERCRMIVNTLHSRLSPGEFDYMAAVAKSDLPMHFTLSPPDESDEDAGVYLA